MMRPVVTLVTAIAVVVGVTAPVSAEGARAEAASAFVVSGGLPDDTLLYQRDPWPNDNTIPNNYGYCPVTPIGGLVTSGSSPYTAGPGSNCVAVNNLTMNTQRTALAGLVDNNVWLYDVHDNGTVTASPKQLFNGAGPRCNIGDAIAWTADGSTITCFWSTDWFMWQNVVTGATGVKLNSSLGLANQRGYTPVWLPNGDLLVTGPVVGCAGTTIWRVAMSGLTATSAATRIGPACPTESIRTPVLSPDGSTLAYLGYGPNGSNYRIATSDLNGANEHVLIPARTTAGDFHSNPVWSPDGRHLLTTLQMSSQPGVPYYYGTRYRTGIAAITVATSAVHWVLPPQATFDARYPVAANVPDATAVSLRPSPTARVAAVNGDSSVTSALSGDTLTITGAWFDPENPPSTVTVCDAAGTTCLSLQVEEVTVDAIGNLVCTVVIPATYTPVSTSGGTTTGTAGGGQSTTGLVFPSGPTAPALTPSPRLFLSPNHGGANAPTTVGVDYLGASQTVQIAAFASIDATGAALAGAVSATASPCGCLIAPFTVPTGTRSIAALSSAGTVITLARWYADDTTPPVVTGTLDRLPDSAGWYNHPATIAWTATDAADAFVAAPAATAVTTQGLDIAYTSAPACDSNGNCASGTVVASLDSTLPTVAAAAFGANPLAVGSPVLVTAAASDALSGVVSGEIWIDSDPGVGNAVPLAIASPGVLGVTLSGMAVGIHTVGVRSLDAAGNWSVAATSLLVVYDPAGGFATGGGWLVPGGATSDSGDLLPRLDGTSKANFGFVVRYENGASTVPSGSFEFHYKVGQFDLSSAGYDWLVVTNSQWAHFNGSVTLNGGSAVYPISVSVRDSNKTGTPDRLVLKVYAPGADPLTASPIYQASGDVSGGNVVLHKG